ncbi:MAG TPA: pyridoxamine 5'-phosphate oxidase family protein [Acidimicrobiales bacterium]|nr:pyridoxamine 5'-phosphate oxidase family protein [Acidimicrobiales bacterium]
MEASNLADLYHLPLMDWARIEARLDQGVSQAPETGGPNRHSCWLSTINPDGSPHVTGVGTVWVDGAFWFETGDRTRKGRNLARDPRCAISLAVHEFDLVVEGTASKVTDPPTVAAMAERWAAEGWPCRVDDSGRALTADFSAPSAGPPPWFVYRVTPRAATALGTVEPGGATRWSF